MTDTNELTGRELAVACARAMGWQILHGMWHRPGEGLPAPLWGFDADPDPDVGEAIDWLHRDDDAAIWLERVTEAPFEPPYWFRVRWHLRGEALAETTGSTFKEALQRLVVAVAQRGSGGRA